MADSMGQSFKASDFGMKGKKKRKGKQEGLDTPESRESRIQLYMARANSVPSADKPTPRKGENGRPVNIFTGVEYTEEELKVVEISEEERAAEMEDE